MESARNPAPTSQVTGHRLLWLGVGVAILGVALYALLAAAGKLHIPWYAPALALLGTGLILLALVRRPTLWRALALLAFGLLTGLESWFLYYSRLPAYAGPLSAGQAFPDFTAYLADGTPFTGASLEGDKDTVLIFFRGWW